jgi:hypothetical protein
MSQHYAIKCTNCAAPLDILGGGRVNTVTCSYCHSILDMNDHYKVLAKFNDTKRPQGPFQIGMRGNIKGVEWTIIGWIAYRTAEFPAEEWSEFFLYSPTHGYAWLVYENSKVYFSKRVRDFDLLAWQEKKPKTLFYHKGHYLQKEASYLTYIDYVEGELNWVAKFGDKFTTWDYDGVGFQVLNIEKTNEEIEVYHTERLDKGDIYNAFGLEYTPKSKTNKSMEKKDIHTLQKEEIQVEHIENSKVKHGFLFLFIIIAILSIMSLFYNKTIYSTRYLYDMNASFKVDSSAFLTAVTLSVSGQGTANNKLWLYKDGKKIFYIDKDNVFFSKKSLSYSWDYNAISTTIYLKLDEGTYSIVAKKNPNQTATSLTIEQQVIRTKYLIPLLVILAFFLFSSYLHLLKGKTAIVLLILVAIIIAYNIFGWEALFGLGLFIYFVTNSYDGYYIGKDEE